MIGIGMLGASRIGPKAVIAPAAKRNDAAIVAVGARNADKAAAYAAEHGIARSGSYDDVLSDPTVDVVYNGLPASHHARWSIAALEAGKHVLCEKPFAMSAAEAQDVLRAAEGSGRRVVEAYHHRYHPLYQLFLNWLAEGRIGQVIRITARFDAPITRPGDIRHAPETGGGAMMDLGCYALAWARDAGGGKPDVVSADAELTPAGVDEAMTAELAFPSGATAHIGCDMGASAERGNMLRVEGYHGYIAFDNPLAPQNGSMLTITTDAGVKTAPTIDGTTYDHQLSALVAGLESGKPLPTEGEAIAAQQRALDAVYHAAGLGDLRRTF